jgi:hypothetical protein
MTASEASAQLIVERVEASRRHITSTMWPKIRRERSIELPMAKKRFEFNTTRRRHNVSLFVRLLPRV